MVFKVCLSCPHLYDNTALELFAHFSFLTALKMSMIIDINHPMGWNDKDAPPLGNCRVTTKAPKRGEIKLKRCTNYNHNQCCQKEATMSVMC